MGLDEAQAITESVLEKDDRVVTATRKFLRASARGFGFGGKKTTTNAAVNKTEHKVSTKKPALYE